MHTRADIHTNTPGTLRTLFSCDPQGYRPDHQTFTPPRAGSVFQAFPHPVRLPRAPSPKTGPHIAAWPLGAQGGGTSRPRACGPITVRPRTLDLVKCPGSPCARVAGRSVQPTCHRNPPEGLAGRRRKERQPPVRPRQDLRRSDQISRSVVSDSLRPHELQHARPPCPSPTPGVHSDSRPSSQ